MDNYAETNVDERPIIVRWTMVALGIMCMGLGGVGVIVPGLPTTVFLILASYFFTRSCPPLDAWMRSSRVFKPYTRYLDRKQPMPVHALMWTLFFVWIGIGFSALRLWGTVDSAWIIAGGASLGSIASASVIWWGRISILRAEKIAQRVTRQP